VAHLCDSCAFLWLTCQTPQQLASLATVWIGCNSALCFAFRAQLQAEISIQLSQHNSILSIPRIEFDRRQQFSLSGTPRLLMSRQHLPIKRTIAWFFGRSTGGGGEEAERDFSLSQFER